MDFKNKIERSNVSVVINAALKFAFVAAFFIFIFAPAHPAAAQVTNTTELAQGVNIIQQPLGLASTDIRIIIARIVRAALGLVGIVILVLILYGGFLWMTAGGNEEQIANAKKIIVNASIGLAIILSAFAIVSFIINMLGLGAGGPGGGPGVGAPTNQNFDGSGALGGIVKDHYPGRNQVDVPRNTKIVITFRKPVRPDSFITNTNNSVDGNGNPILGDCIIKGQTINWATDCDALNTNAIQITRVDNGQPIRGAAVLASYESGKLFTIVIRPYDYLGDSVTKVPYAVKLTDAIKLDDPANGNPSAFSSAVIGNNYYVWQFTCSTELDLTPPHVKSVFPAPGTTEAKNSVIQVDFDKPVDPTGIQGIFTTGTPEIGVNSYVLDGNNIFVQSGASSKPSGTLRLTNGYHTLEFTPDIECGANACGGKIYCLPVCDEPGANCTRDNFEMLLKAAQTISTSTFEAVPFSGVADLSGNAMDSIPYGLPPQIATTTPPVFHTWEQPENYFWKFTIKDEIDLSSPYLQRIAPGLDGAFIGPQDLWQMIFSKRMRVDPLYDNIGIQEYPAPQNGIPLCKVPRAFFNLDGTTDTRMDHCPFISGTRQYYFPTVDSGVEDVHFNCFYPGKGPGDTQGPGTGAAWTAQGSNHAPISPVCDDAHPDNCCAVTSTPETDALCCNGIVDNVNGTNKADCIKRIKNNTIL